MLILEFWKIFYPIEIGCIFVPCFMSCPSLPPRLYKPRLFELLDGGRHTSPQMLSYDEFSFRIRNYLVANNHIRAGQPRYLHIKLNHESMFELTGLHGETAYTLVDGYTELRTWDDFLGFLQRKWAI